MRTIVKTASRIDTIRTLFLMAPAVLLLANAGLNMQNGEGTPEEFSQAAAEVATQFTDQYTPYVETTGAAILAGTRKMVETAASCASPAGRPVYTSPGMTHKNGCALGNRFSSMAPIKPYRYHP